MNNKIKTFSAVAALALGSFSATDVYANDANVVRLATTTSTYHSGLLDYLLPEFKKIQATKFKFLLLVLVKH